MQEQGIDTIRNVIHKAIGENSQLNLRTLSRRLKKNDAYLHQFLYRKTPKQLPEDVRYKLAALLGLHESELRDSETSDISIPDAVAVTWLDMHASAGHGSIAEDDNSESRNFIFDRHFLHQICHGRSEQLRLMPVKGDSMSPILEDGDIILVDLADTRPTPPGIFVLFDGMGVVAKSLELVPAGLIRIISANGYYTAYQRALQDITIIGRVVWFSRKLVRLNP